MWKAVSRTAGKIQKGGGEELVRQKGQGGKPSPGAVLSGAFSFRGQPGGFCEQQLNSVHLSTLSSLEEESGLQHLRSLLEAKQ